MMFFKYFIFAILSFSLFMVTSCGGRGGESHPSPPQRDDDPPISDPEYPDPDGCQSKIISYDECFFILPTLAHNQVFKSFFEDPSRMNTTGVVVGKGVWQCIKREWYVVQKPVCLICLPGRTLEHCKSQLNSL